MFSMCDWPTDRYVIHPTIADKVVSPQNPTHMTDESHQPESASSPSPATSREPQWVSAAVAAEPRLPLMGPMMAYLFLMLFTDFAPATTPWNQVAIALHIAAAAWFIRVLRNHYPPLGKLELGIAIPAGIASAAVWVFGQQAFDAMGLGGALGISGAAPFITLEPVEATDMTTVYAGAGFWAHAVLKILRAMTVVAIAEELFWRGFMLRAFIKWDDYDQVPLGTFTLFSCVGTALLSVIQHPGNWGVSIVLWILWNLLFCWRRSLKCLMVTHGVTNLVLYAYVVWYGGDAWRFW